MTSAQSAPAKIESPPKEVWRAVAQQKIYFGHMSVGFNILDGVRDLMKETPGVSLEIWERSDPSFLDKPVFAHSPIGRNTDPLSKIQDFRRILESGVGDKADIAFFKLCYVDIHGGTDVEALIRAYDRMMEDLRTRFPKLILASVTAPLTAIPSGFKESFKKLLGRGGGEQAANVKRDVFNAHLREKYGKLVFDLAALESTGADGRRTSFVEGGKTYYALDPAYTDDGGHLNGTGRRIVAAALLRFLAGIGPRP